MFRLRHTLVLLLVGTGGLAYAGSDSKGDGKGHGAAPVYQATYHDEDHKQVTKKFDFKDPAAAKELLKHLEAGHVHEVENQSAPDIGTMASIRYDLGLWSLFIFGVLFLVMRKFAWPNMVAGLQRREGNIRSALEEAEKARAEAKTLMADLERERAEAAGKVKAIIDEAKRDALATAEQIKADNMAQIAEERERLRREIKLETDQAMQGIWAKAADLATQAAATAIRGGTDGAQHRRLIDDAINDIRKLSA